MDISQYGNGLATTPNQRCSMGSLGKSRSLRAKIDCPGKRPLARKIVAKASNRAQAEALEFPRGLENEIENQRGALVTVITLLHCLHVALEHRQDHFDEKLNPYVEAAVRCASLPEITAMLLERTHAVHSALESINLTKALEALKL
jgi:hypothetical protein